MEADAKTVLDAYHERMREESKLFRGGGSGRFDIGRMKFFKLLCSLGFLAVLASNVWSMSRWSESRGVYDDICYLRQAHLFEKFGLRGIDTNTVFELKSDVLLSYLVDV